MRCYLVSSVGRSIVRKVVSPNQLSAALFSSASKKHDNLYTVLGLSPTATQREIKDAFYSLSKIHHPDRISSEGTGIKFHELSSAYEILGDPAKRVDYDRGLVVPKSKGNEASARIDLETLRKSSAVSFESHYVKAYNKQLNNEWRQHADVNLSKSAFDCRVDQRNFITVLYTVLFGSVVGGFFITKYFEEPIPLLQTAETK